MALNVSFLTCQVNILGEVSKKILMRLLTNMNLSYLQQHYLTHYFKQSLSILM